MSTASATLDLPALETPCVECHTICVAVLPVFWPCNIMHWTSICGCAYWQGGYGRRQRALMYNLVSRIYLNTLTALPPNDLPLTPDSRAVFREYVRLTNVLPITGVSDHDDDEDSDEYDEDNYEDDD